MASKSRKQGADADRSSDAPERRRAGVLAVFCAAILYGALFIAWTWPLALHARTHVAAQSIPDNEDFQKIYVRDQMLSAATVGRNARLISQARFADLLDPGFCYPVRYSAALGEHMIESSFLATPGWWFARDPLFAFNFASLAQVAIAGAGMFALVRYFTASSAAGFIAGLLFAFFEVRVVDLAHPTVRGTHWIPFVLLFFDKLLVRGKRLDACFLALVTILAALTGSYPLLVLITFALPYAVLRFLTLRRYLDRRRIQLLMAAVLGVGITLGLVLFPYFSVRAAWGIGGRDAQLFAGYLDYFPSGLMFAGYSTLLLAVAGLCFGRQIARGVAGAALVAAVCCFVVATTGPLWSGGPQLPRLYAGFANVLPMLMVIRVPAAIAQGIQIGLCLAAGLGAAFVFAAVGTGPARRLVTVLLILVPLIELVAGPLAFAALGRPRPIRLFEIAPSTQQLSAYAALDVVGGDGPVVDLPLRRTVLAKLSHEALPTYVLLAGYHARPTTSCYNSYMPPSLWSVQAIADRLPDASAVRALAAAGLQNIVMHEVDDVFVDGMESNPGVRLVYRDGQMASFRIDLPAQETIRSPQALLPRSVDVPVGLGGILKKPAALYVSVANRGDRPWAEERPLKPMDAQIRFTPADGGSSGPWISKKMLLPLGIGAHGTGVAVILINDADLPSPGRYQVDVSVPGLGWNFQPSAVTEVS